MLLMLLMPPKLRRIIAVKRAVAAPFGAVVFIVAPIGTAPFVVAEPAAAPAAFVVRRVFAAVLQRPRLGRELHPPFASIVVELVSAVVEALAAPAVSSLRGRRRLGRQGAVRGRGRRRAVGGRGRGRSGRAGRGRS
jgi:hypothetical protein